MRNYIVVGLGQEWKKPVNKENLMRCMGCHAPQLQDASESLITEVAGLIVSAVDEKNDAKKTAARKELEKLNVNCIVCHNLKSAVDRNLRGKPKPGTMYGPSGGASPAHPTEQTPVIPTALFCGQCHGIHTAPDGDDIVCNTLYGSYIDGFRANGGSETCQDCHMKKKDRGHRFPGAYDADIVRDGIGVEVQATGIRLTPGVWTPTAVVTVDLINRAGHRIPDG